MPLPLASIREAVRVMAINRGQDLEKRLVSMGIAPGSELRLIQREGGNFVVMVGNSRIALGHGLAQKILVMPLERDSICVETRKDFHEL